MYIRYDGRGGLIRMKKYLFAVLMVILLVGCTVDNQPTEEEPETSTEEMINEPEENEKADTASEEEETTTNELTVLAENLNAPWSIEKINDTFYITERPGAIVKVEDEKETRQEVSLSNDLATADEAGFMGFALAPDFEETNQAYAYYTYTDENGQFNKVITLILEESQWREESVLLDQIPSGPYHHGGRVKIGPDDKLYITVGDALEENLAQQTDSLAGTILRMNLDGSIPEDNPFEDSYVYSYGHRNVQGMSWLSDDTMYASEHGNSANDEINLIEAGANYGWPLIEGIQEQEGLVTPEFTSGSDTTWAPSGMDVHDNKLYVAGLRGNAVFVFDLETGEERAVLTDYGRIRDVYIEEDYLYFITNNTDGRGNPEDADDRLYRIGISELE